MLTVRSQGWQRPTSGRSYGELARRDVERDSPPPPVALSDGSLQLAKTQRQVWGPVADSEVPPKFQHESGVCIFRRFNSNTTPSGRGGIIARRMRLASKLPADGECALAFCSSEVTSLHCPR